MAKKKFGTYHFKVVLSGSGETPEEAWNDAVEGFNEDAGACPEKEDYEIVEEEE